MRSVVLIVRPSVTHESGNVAKIFDLYVLPVLSNTFTSSILYTPSLVTITYLLVLIASEVSLI